MSEFNFNIITFITMHPAGLCPHCGVSRSNGTHMQFFKDAGSETGWAWGCRYELPVRMPVSMGVITGIKDE